MNSQGPQSATASARLNAEIEALLRDAHALVDGLNAERLVWTPAPGRWSIAQCLNHVVVTGEEYLPPLDRAIQEGRARRQAGRGPVRGSWIGDWFVRAMEPPPRMRIRTFRRLEPPAQPDGAAALPRFVEFHQRLATRFPALDELGERGAAMRSPFMPLLRLTLGQGMRSLLVHARRHLWQAGEVRRAAGFPGGG